MAIKVDLNNYNYAADELKKTPDYYSDAIFNIDTVLRNLDYKVLAYVKSDLIDIKNSLNTMSSFALELQEDLVSTKAKYLQAEEKAKNVGSTIISIASTLGGAAIGATTGGAIGAAIGGAAGSAIGASLGESTKAASSIGAAFEKAGEAIVNTAATVGNYVTSAASKIAGFFSDVGDFLWTGVKKVGASVANTVIGLFQGLDEFVEAIGDTCAIIGTAAASIFTGAYDLVQWIGSKISGNENWNSATKAMWNSTMDNVAVTHAKNAYKDFYENNPIGQWLDANAFDWFKSTGAAYQVANGLGYVAGVILLTIATFGIGGAAIGGGAAATGAATTTATISVTAGQTALIAGTAGFGRGAETAWSQGATLGEGLTYAALNAGWEGLQFYVGSKIGAPGGYGDQVANRILSQSAGAGTRALVTSGTRVTLDALDGGIEGFIQPLLQATYADGYYDESGNFINFTENDDLFTRANALFDDMGGWSNVAIQTAIGGGGSLIGEAGDLRRFLKASSTSSTPDITDVGFLSIIDEDPIDIDINDPNLVTIVEPTDIIDATYEEIEPDLTPIPKIKEQVEINDKIDLTDVNNVGENIEIENGTLDDINVRTKDLTQLEQKIIDKVSRLKEINKISMSQEDGWESETLYSEYIKLKKEIVESGMTGGQLASIIPLADQGDIGLLFIDDSMLKTINERLDLSNVPNYFNTENLKSGIFETYNYERLLDYESSKIFEGIRNCRGYLSETDYNDLMKRMISNQSVNLDGKINIASTPTFTGEISSIALISSFRKNLSDSSTYAATVEYLKKYVSGELNTHDVFNIIHTNLSKYCDYSTPNAYTNLLNHITGAYNSGNTAAALHNLEYLAKKLNQGDLEFKMVPGEAYASSIVFALNPLVNAPTTSFHEFGHVMHIDSQGYNIPIRGAELLEKAKNNALQNGGLIINYLNSIQKNIDIAAEQASISFDNWVIDTYGSEQGYINALKEHYKNYDIQNFIDEFGKEKLGISEETAKILKISNRTLDSLVRNIYYENRNSYIEFAERQTSGNAITDCISAVFKDRNIVIDGQQVPIKYAHDAKYWSETPFNSYTEIIAQYNSLLLSGNQEGISFLRLAFGDEFMDAIDEIYNATY